MPFSLNLFKPSSSIQKRLHFGSRIEQSGIRTYYVSACFQNIFNGCLNLIATSNNGLELKFEKPISKGVNCAFEKYQNQKIYGEKRYKFYGTSFLLSFLNDNSQDSTFSMKNIKEKIQSYFLHEEKKYFINFPVLLKLTYEKVKKNKLIFFDGMVKAEKWDFFTQYGLYNTVPFLKYKFSGKHRIDLASSYFIKSRASFGAILGKLHKTMYFSSTPSLPGFSSTIKKPEKKNSIIEATLRMGRTLKNNLNTTHLKLIEEIDIFFHIGASFISHNSNILDTARSFLIGTFLKPTPPALSSSTGIGISNLISINKNTKTKVELLFSYPLAKNTTFRNWEIGFDIDFL